jgi:hypothetical protein
MLKHLVITLAAISFLAACAKKSDNPAPAPATAPVTTQTPPGPKPQMPPGQVQDPAKDPIEKQEDAGKKSEDETPSRNYLYGTADDYAALYLEIKLSREKDPAKRIADMKRAGQILSAEMKNKKGGVVSVNLTLAGRPHAQEITLSGQMNAKGGATLTGNAKSSQAPLQVRGELKCLDHKPSRDCGTTAATVDFTENGKSSTAMILFRTSDAIFNITFPVDDAVDAEYVNIVKLFKNTEFETGSANSLKILRMDSVEVINGLAQMKVIMLSRENELILLKVPLNEQEAEQLPLEVDKSISIEEAMDLTNHQPFKDNVSASMTSVDLVGNNGRGNLTFSVRMKALEKFKAKEIKMTFKRKMKPVSF